MNKGKVSIIIPVYNGANYMGEAIDSALAQTYPDIEIIVVNDGSNDNGETREIALSYGNKIRYFEKENGGVSTALNLGIKNMRGEYFSWLSHDDLYYPNKIEAEVQALMDSGNMEQVVYSGYELLHMPEGEIITCNEVEETYSSKYLESGLCAVTFGFISGCSLLIPKRYFDIYGYFDEDLRTTQDYAKWFDMIRDKRVVYVPRALIKSRVHDSQVGNTYDKFQEECDELHLWMMKNIRESDASRMGWDMYHFYSIMLFRLYNARFINAYRYVYKQLHQLPESIYAEERVSILKETLFSAGTRKLYLYCMGRRGQALLEYLQLRGIQVKACSDSNAALWGREIHGIPCVAPEEIPRENSLLIVTKAKPKELVLSLKKDFNNVISYDDIKEQLCEVPVLKKYLPDQL